MHITHNFEVAAKKFGTLPTGATALCATAVLLSHDKPQYFARARDSPPHNTPMLSPTLAAPVLNHKPFRSKEHSTASGTPSEHTLATSPPGTGDPHSSEGALPTFRPTRHDGWDGPVLWCPSASPRVGETRGKTEWRGTHARMRPEAPMVG